MTAASLDSRKRKLYLGDSSGGISCFNASTGAELARSQPHAAEVTQICPWPGTKCFVSASSDGLVLVHEEVGTPQVTQPAALNNVTNPNLNCQSVLPSVAKSAIQPLERCYSMQLDSFLLCCSTRKTLADHRKLK